MAIRVRRFDDVDAYWDHVRSFLLEDEARHNLMLGIITTLRERPDLYDEKFLASVDDDAGVVAAVLTTPPFNAVVSDVHAPQDRADAVCAAIIDGLASAFSELTGITANQPVAAHLSERWQRRSGRGARLHLSQGVYRLEHVIPPPAVAGRVRSATPSDQALVLDWYTAFNLEARLDAPRHIVERMLVSRLRGEGGGIDLWEHEGRPVSLTAFASNTPNGARIGPVYTPPEHRRRGYASALVAATTQRLLDQGRSFCFLYTDLANPTSNHIYRAIGYEQVCVAEDWRFEQPRES